MPSEVHFKNHFGAQYTIIWLLFNVTLIMIFVSLALFLIRKLSNSAKAA
jgi:hypothetical protein